jgi:hypothetical protein
VLFSQKPNAILFVERDTITLHPKANTTPASLTDEVFKYLEVRDTKKLSEILADFAKKGNVKGKRLLIVLHKDVVLQKVLTLDKDSNVQSITADYEHKVPFNAEDRRAVSLKQKERLYLFGANKAFYQLLVGGMEEAGAKVQAVVPGLVYGITEPGKLTHTKVDQICDATALTKAVNFLA